MLWLQALKAFQEYKSETIAVSSEQSGSEVQFQSIEAMWSGSSGDEEERNRNSGRAVKGFTDWEVPHAGLLTKHALSLAQHGIVSTKHALTGRRQARSLKVPKLSIGCRGRHMLMQLRVSTCARLCRCLATATIT